jgi:hypothetical protein
VQVPRQRQTGRRRPLASPVESDAGAGESPFRIGSCRRTKALIECFRRASPAGARRGGSSAARPTTNGMRCARTHNAGPRPPADPGATWPLGPPVGHITPRRQLLISRPVRARRPGNVATWPPHPGEGRCPPVRHPRASPLELRVFHLSSGDNRSPRRTKRASRAPSAPAAGRHARAAVSTDPRRRKISPSLLIRRTSPASHELTASCPIPSSTRRSTRRTLTAGCGYNCRSGPSR